MELTIDVTAMSSGVDIGYKVTDIGIFPNDWDIKPLETFWFVKDCKHVTAKFFDDGYPLASINEVQSRFVDLKDAKKTNHSFYTQLIEGGRSPQAGDLIVSRNATVGEIAQVADWHPPFAMGQDVCLLRKKKRDFSSCFMQELFKSNVITRQLELLMVGSTFKRVNIQQIRNLIIPFPSPNEQLEISTVLNSIDNTIESLGKLIAKKNNIKQGVMQNLLTPKNGWVEKMFGDIAEFDKGKQLNISDMSESGLYPAINGGVEPSGYTDTYNNLANTITISEGGNSCGYVNYITENFWCGGHCYAISRVDSEVDPSFLYWILKFQQKKIMDLRVGSGLPNIQKNRLRTFLLNMPKKKEVQADISLTLFNIDSEIKSLLLKLGKYKILKSGMMQELLTGKTRLIKRNSKV